MDEAGELLKALPAQVVGEAYSDAAKRAMVEAGSLGADALKTVRLALFPLQLAGAIQDRLAAHIERAIRSVPPERRVAPVQSLALLICERLRMHEDGELIGQLYGELLSRAIDRDRVGEAHPAFLLIIGQLAPDEALLLRMVAQAGPMVAMMLGRLSRRIPPLEERMRAIGDARVTEEDRALYRSIEIEPEALAYPPLVDTYIEHLVSLGLLEYRNDNRPVEIVSASMVDHEVYFLSQSSFGTLFYGACVEGASFTG